MVKKVKQMKICLVSFIAPYTIPYINIYLRKIKNANVECDLVFWDRDGNFKEKIEDGIHYLPFSSIAHQTQSKLKRYLQYIPVTKFIRQQLKQNKYDKVIFLQTHAAVACKGILLRQYPQKYLMDIRDYTLENFSLYRKAEREVIQNSYSTVISSKGYKAFLPEYEYIIAHNYTPIKEEIVKEIRDREAKKSCINISFIGNVRFYEMAKKLLLLFANDSRFHVSYIGTGAVALEAFCKENNINNVTLHDRFKPEETAKFYKECDLINNLYGNHNKFLDYALSNKLYYAAQFQIPVLVSEETYSSKIAEKYHIGISWNPDEKHAVDKLYNKFCEFDKSKMKKSSEDFLNMVIHENEIFENKIAKFIDS